MGHRLMSLSAILFSLAVSSGKFINGSVPNHNVLIHNQATVKPYAYDKDGMVKLKEFRPQTPAGHLFSYTPSVFSDIQKHCQIEMEDGTITTKDPDTNIVIENLGNKFSTKPSLLVNIKFYGPVLISQGTCSCLLFGRSFCVGETQALHVLSTECNLSSDPKLKGLVSALVLLCILLYLFMRMFWVRVFATPSGFKRVSTNGTCCMMTVKLSDKYNRHIFRFSRHSGTQVVERSEKNATWTFSPMALLLAILLFKYPAPAYTTEMGLVGKTLVASEGSVLKTNYGFMQVMSSHEEFPLHMEYYSAAWTTRLESDWHCYTSKCDQWGPCNSFPPSGLFTTNKLTRSEHNPRTYYIRKKYCVPITTGCFVNNGCQQWIFDYILDIDSQFTVFTPGQSSQVLQIFHTGQKNLILTSVQLADKFQKEESRIIYDRNSHYWYCPFPSNKADPRGGALGDIQYNSDKYYSISPHMEQCRGLPWADPVCDEPTSFYFSYQKACKMMPTTVGSYELSVKNGVLLVRKTGNVVISFIGPSDLSIEQKAGNCSIMKKEAWITESSLYPSYVVIQFSPSTANASMEISLPCTSAKVTVPCDGKPHQFEETSDKNCKITDPDFTVTKLTDDQMSFYHQTVSQVRSTEDEYRSLVDLMGHPSLATLLSMLSSTTVIVILLVIYFLCRRG